MHEFFRMGREERAKNLAAAGRQRHRADQKEMRFRKRLEDRFVEQTAAKVNPTLFRFFCSCCCYCCCPCSWYCWN